MVNYVQCYYSICTSATICFRAVLLVYSSMKFLNKYRASLVIVYILVLILCTLNDLTISRKEKQSISNGKNKKFEF